MSRLWRTDTRTNSGKKSSIQFELNPQQNIIYRMNVSFQIFAPNRGLLSLQAQRSGPLWAWSQNKHKNTLRFYSSQSTRCKVNLPSTQNHLVSFNILKCLNMNDMSNKNMLSLAHMSQPLVSWSTKHVNKIDVIVTKSGLPSFSCNRQTWRFSPF